MLLDVMNMENGLLDGSSQALLLITIIKTIFYIQEVFLCRPKKMVSFIEVLI